jgi:hypothetical protein
VGALIPLYYDVNGFDVYGFCGPWSTAVRCCPSFVFPICSKEVKTYICDLWGTDCGALLFDNVSTVTNVPVFKTYDCYSTPSGCPSS